MEFTDSYGYKPDLLWPWHRLEKADIGRLLFRRIQQERASLELLVDSLPALREQARKDPWPLIKISHTTGEHRGWVIAQHEDITLSTQSREAVTIALSDEGELWRGAFDLRSRRLEAESDYVHYSAPKLAWLHRAYEAQIAAPLVDEQEDPFLASTLQRPDSSLASTLDFLLHPRTIR